MRATLGLIFLLAALSCLGEAKANETGGADKDDVGVVTAHRRGLHGYIGYSASRPPERSARKTHTSE